MAQNILMTLEQLCSTYGLNKNVLSFEMKRMKSQGVTEGKFLLFHQLRLQGVIKFPTSKIPIQLAPKKAVLYDDCFFLSMKDVCNEYQIQRSLVKQYHKTGISLSSAIDKARRKSVSAPKAKEPNYTIDELDFLKLSDKARKIVMSYDLDIGDAIYQASTQGKSIEEYILMQGEVLLGNAPPAGFINDEVTTTNRTSTERVGLTTTKGSGAVIKALGSEGSMYNLNTLTNDSFSLRMAVNEFVEKAGRYGMLPLYLKEGVQPSFSFRGRVYPSFETFVQENGLTIIDLRLTIFTFEGDINRAIALAFTKREGGSGRGGKTVIYRGTPYGSIRALSNKFNIPYDNLVKSLKPCFLPNPPRSINEVVDELIFNSHNNYITVGDKRVILETPERGYKSVAQLCRLEGIKSNHLGVALKRGATLEQAIAYAKSKVVKVS